MVRPPTLKKTLAILAISFGTLIAGLMISGVITERQDRQEAASTEIAQGWGPAQIIDSPLLIIPYDRGSSRHYFKIAPTHLKLDARLQPQTRKRGLFRTTVYDAAIQMEGSFALPTEARAFALDRPSIQILWAESFVLIPSSALSGMHSGDQLTWNGAALPWQACQDIVKDPLECQHAGVLAHVALEAPAQPGTSALFSATLHLRGSGVFGFNSQGRTLEASIQSPWRDPSFRGIPANSTDTDANGFTAHWASIDYSAPLLRISDHVMPVDPSPLALASVDLIEAVPTYQKVSRVSKYSILLVTLSFTTYFLLELLSRVSIHPAQYGLLGASLCLFGLLLVAFSEPLGYDLAYLISAGLVVAQAGAYTQSVLRRRRLALGFTAGLSILFGFLYLLLSLETYALLVGSLALFLVLSAVMALSQRIHWRPVSPVEAAP